jgi:hypothetical protein
MFTNIFYKTNLVAIILLDREYTLYNGAWLDTPNIGQRVYTV